MATRIEEFRNLFEKATSKYKYFDRYIDSQGWNQFQPLSPYASKKLL